MRYTIECVCTFLIPMSRLRLNRICFFGIPGLRSVFNLRYLSPLVMLNQKKKILMTSGALPVWVYTSALPTGNTRNATYSQSTDHQNHELFTNIVKNVYIFRIAYTSTTTVVSIHLPLRQQRKKQIRPPRILARPPPQPLHLCLAHAVYRNTLHNPLDRTRCVV